MELELALDIETERWEAVIEHELWFYTNFSKYEKEVKDALLENELDIQVATTRFENGQVYVYRPSTEDQALKRIEVRDSLNAILERANRRIKRLFNALDQLSEVERSVISLLYFDVEVYPLSKIMSELGLSGTRDLRFATQRILKKLYNIYDQERVERHKEHRRMLKEKRMELAKRIKESLGSGDDGKEQH